MKVAFTPEAISLCENVYFTLFLLLIGIKKNIKSFSPSQNKYWIIYPSELMNFRHTMQNLQRRRPTNAIRTILTHTPPSTAPHLSSRLSCCCLADYGEFLITTEQFRGRFTNRDLYNMQENFGATFSHSVFFLFF